VWGDEHGRRDATLSVFGAVEVGADEERDGDHGVPCLAHQLEPRQGFHGQPDQDLPHHLFQQQLRGKDNSLVSLSALAIDRRRRLLLLGTHGGAGN
jgi:hypothetical protein